MEVVRTLDELDAKLRLVDQAFQESDDAMRAVFRSFRLEIDHSAAGDPWSEAYRQGQFELYERIANRGSYSTENEAPGYSVDSRIPFPYYTKNSELVADHLMAIAFLIKVMALDPGASVLEYGPGWGNTSITLARMGYDVRAIDIDANFVDMIRERSDRLGLNVRSEVGEFLDGTDLGEQFDAVLFFECFHHCSDHVQLLTRLHDVVKPGGQVVLASEPIVETFHAPWGLRLDGESVWAIRSNGWLELGFTESYFLETCLRTGWNAVKHTTDATPLGTVYVLRSIRDRPVGPGTVTMPAADDRTWAPAETPPMDQRFTSERSRLVVETGRSAAEIVVELHSPAPRSLHALVEHGAHRWDGVVAPGAIATVRLPYDPTAGEIVVGAATWVPAEEITGSDDRRRIGIGVRSVTLR